MRESRAYPLLLALPGVVLAAAGLFHPTGLNYDTAQLWYLLHLPGLLVFPLVGWALADLVAGRRDVVAWVVRATAYVYATFYTALDVVSGIGAGYVTRQLGPDVPRPEAVSLMFRIGTPLGEVGSWALLACVVVLLADRVRALGVGGLVGLVLLPGAWLVHTEHIFSPLGVLGMLLLGAGSAALAVVARRTGVIAHTSDR
ncbi:hypothetical protein ENKNEFLB_01863 [Nocardioides aquaticus]|uniref:Uncharacterized protein n=1 Tax=Nocardioides aquaticus TaxID=160826 RepID=A0ABX8EGN6_9ACTN|nr:hypothetical protein [Nocardioides aquaticus]QVT79481.1 hypothetical protein ENKNEFLB_01863 [Nocardioides aquaticus]